MTGFKAEVDAEDRADCESRLARARTRSRARYLRIQACQLAETDLHRDAPSLLERLLEEYPDGIVAPRSPWLRRAVNREPRDE
jgi:hypothetical protein